MSKLSGTFASDEAGLPRGRTSLNTLEAREKQKRRIVKGAISAFAEKGYAATTITDIVKNARVSRQVFYEMFDTKEDCLLLADALGRYALQPEIDKVASNSKGEKEAWIREFIHAYLKLCQDEAEFALVWAIQFPSVSMLTFQKRDEFFQQLANALKSGHRKLWQGDKPIATYADHQYRMAIGGAVELIYAYIGQRRFDELALIEDDVVAFILRCLELSPNE